MVIFYLVWMFLKSVREKGVISNSSCLDVLKIRMERRGNDLNRKIYTFLKIKKKKSKNPNPMAKKKRPNLQPPCFHTKTTMMVWNQKRPNLEA